MFTGVPEEASKHVDFVGGHGGVVFRSRFSIFSDLVLSSSLLCSYCRIPKGVRISCTQMANLRVSVDPAPENKQKYPRRDLPQWFSLPLSSLGCCFCPMNPTRNESKSQAFDVFSSRNA